MNEEIERYLESRRAHLKPAPLKSVERHLRRFAHFCGLSDLAELQRGHLQSYYGHLLEHCSRGRSYPSLGLLTEYLGSLDRFLRWAQRERLIFLKWEVPRPRVPQKLPRVPHHGEIERLLKEPDSSTVLGRRDQLALELLYGWGLRLGECTRLNLESFDVAENSVSIWGKGDRYRRVPLSPRLRELYEDYVARTRPRFQPAAHERALFLSLTNGLRLTPTGLYLRVKVYAWQAGLDLHPHQLRHACATHMLAAGARVRQVQTLLGHAQVTTTQRYTRLSLRDLKREFQRCHPRAHFPHEEDCDEGTIPRSPAPGRLLS